MKNPFRIVGHACKMARRNLKKYSLLSVTIILSFALLLGYFLFSDASTYNTYKELFQKDPGIVMVWDNLMETEKFQLLTTRAGAMGNTRHYFYCVTFPYLFGHGQQLENGEPLGTMITKVYCVPSRMWDFYHDLNSILDIRYLDGVERRGLTLFSGQILMDEELFYALGLDRQENPTYRLKLSCPENGDPISYTLEAQVIGTFAANNRFDAPPDSPLGAYQPTIVLSMEDLRPDIMPHWSWSRTAVFHTDMPDQVLNLAKAAALSGGYSSMASAQNQAREKILTQKSTKEIVAIGMLLLLGINLYSSFSNALSERKFEIGVKRAIGASQWAIVRQFLYESILVLLADILLAVAIVADIALIYQYIIEHTPDEYGRYIDWIIYISPASITMFAICAVTLTLLFSFIFAYKATQVEVVKYLKAE